MRLRTGISCVHWPCAGLACRSLAEEVLQAAQRRGRGRYTSGRLILDFRFGRISGEREQPDFLPDFGTGSLTLPLLKVNGPTGLRLSGMADQCK